MIWVLLFIVLCIISFVWESSRECNTISAETQVIKSVKVSRNYRFVFLSDLHDKEFGEGNERLIKAVQDTNPDAILIGGDMMNVRKGKVGTKITEQLLAGLTKVAPVYYANGNNEQRFLWEIEDFGDEYKDFLRILKEYNVHYLDNITEALDDVTITGLNIELEHYKEFICKKLTKEFIENAVGQPVDDKYNILLIHSPMFPEAYREWGADLALTGHSHGGIIRFPTDWKRELGRLNNDRGLISGQYQLFHKYCSGYFMKDGKAMIVSRGLGTHTVNVRINNKPQVVVVDLMEA